MMAVLVTPVETVLLGRFGRTPLSESWRSPVPVAGVGASSCPSQILVGVIVIFPEAESVPLAELVEIVLLLTMTRVPEAMSPVLPGVGTITDPLDIRDPVRTILVGARTTTIRETGVAIFPAASFLL
jgi:hypothetical protein